MPLAEPVALDGFKRRGSLLDSQCSGLADADYEFRSAHCKVLSTVVSEISESGLQCPNALGLPEGSLRSSLHANTGKTDNATGLPGGYLRSQLL